MKTNNEILAERVLAFNQIDGPRVGDFLKLPYGLWTRFTHIWEDSLQTGWGSFYFGKGYCSYSGGLDTGVKRTDILSSTEIKEGQVWFFNKDYHQAHNGVYFDIPFRVFKLRVSANTSGLPQIKRFERERFLKKVATVTRINGNGQPYTLPLPEIQIFCNDETAQEIETFTGIKFAKSWGYAFQPVTYNDFKKIILSKNFNATFYCNSTSHNVLKLELDTFDNRPSIEKRAILEILASPENLAIAL